MNNEKRFFAALKGLVFYKDKFIIVKRSEKARDKAHTWELPGGRLEFGETPIEALKRELKEETGIEANPICPINTWNIYKDNNIQVIGITYLCTSDDDNVRISEEHEDYRWITSDEIRGFDFYPGSLKSMEEWDWNFITGKIKNS